MFNREDYWPYVAGASLLGGLLVVPLVWSVFSDMAYGRLFAGSIVLCAVFLFVHTRTGSIEIFRLLGAVAVGALFFMTGVEDWQPTLYIGGGLIGFAAMVACGWLGIVAARATGLSAKLVTSDPTVLTSYNGDAPETEATAAPTDLHPDHVFDQGQLDQLLQRTHAAWQADELAHLSPHFKSMADSKSLAKLDKLFFRPHLNAIAFAFTRGPPDDDEYLICADDGGVRLSFVLTNKYFYFFGIDDDPLANKYESGKVPLDRISACDVNSGLVFTKAALTLDDGTSLNLRDLTSDAGVNYIAGLAAGRHGDFE